MSIMSCYTGFFNMRRGWQSLNTGPRFYLRLIRTTGWLWINISRTTDGRPFKPKKLSVPFLYPGVPARLTPFRGLVPLGRRNRVPILPPAPQHFRTSVFSIGGAVTFALGQWSSLLRWIPDKNDRSAFTRGSWGEVMIFFEKNKRAGVKKVFIHVYTLIVYLRG